MNSASSANTVDLCGKDEQLGDSECAVHGDWGGAKRLSLSHTKVDVERSLCLNEWIKYIK